MIVVVEKAVAHYQELETCEIIDGNLINTILSDQEYGGENMAQSIAAT